MAIRPVVCPLGVLACSDASDTAPQEPPGQVQSPMWGQQVVIDNTTSTGVLGATAAIQYGGPSGCSGALAFNRQFILTAAHCLVGVANVTVTFPQTADFGTSGAITFTNNGVGDIFIHPQWFSDDEKNRRAHDVALIRLNSMVPPSIATPAKVWTGNGNPKELSLFDPYSYRIAGFGCTSDQCSGGNPWTAANPPIRRTGPMQANSLYFSDDDKDFLGEYDYFETPMWLHTQNKVFANPEKGDSGGPLFATSPTEGEMVVGVCSHGYGYWSPIDLEEDRWAQTGSVDSSNGMWLLQTVAANSILPDVDGDGLADNGQDLCPPWRCSTLDGPKTAICHNGDQTDADGDGVGDACDNCPPSRCTTPGACRNPSQTDSDKDGIGDACDPCPKLEGDGGGDADGDGVGNACDNCRDNVKNGYQPCTTSADCPGAVCITDSGAPHCNKQLDDPDGDGLGNACDACPGTANRGNENKLAELAASVSALDDACEGVPLMAADAVRPGTIFQGKESEMIHGDGIGPEDVVEIDAVSWLGNGPGTPSTPTPADVRFVHCSCYKPSTGTKNYEECVGKGLTCDTTNPAYSASWRPITLEGIDGTPSLLAPSYKYQETFTRAKEGAWRSWQWRWYDDLQSGAVHGAEVNPLTNRQGTRGAIAAVVLKPLSGPIFSSRDAISNLRHTIYPSVTGYYDHHKLPDPNETQKGPCGGSSCIKIIFDQNIWDENWALNLRAITGHAALTSVDRYTLELPSGARLDASNALSTGMKSVMDSTRPTLWLTPVESGKRRRTLGLDHIEAALLPSNLPANHRPDLVVATRRGLELASEGRDWPSPGQPPSGPFTNPRRNDVHAVFSAVEQAIYVVGGADRLGQYQAGIWRYSFRSNQWSPIRTTIHELGDRVLSVAYDQTNSRLYVLDVGNETHDISGQQKHLVRLTAYNLQNGTAARLKTWEHRGTFETLRISSAEDGSLILQAGQPSGYTACRLDVLSRTSPITGAVHNPHRLADQAFMGDESLMVPVLKNNTVVFERLLLSTFTTATSCPNAL